jgi:methionyl-tRNA synthetase
MEIDLKDFKGLDLRVGEVIGAEDVKGSDKLIKLMVDIGKTRQAVAGVREWYAPEELVGKKVVFLANLEPAVIFGVESRGMILAAQDANGVSILTVDSSVENGTRIK